MTKQQLIDNATARKFSIEFNQDQYGNEIIGINKGKWNYHWFKVLSNQEVYFYQTYSQVNGKTKKGVMHSIKVERSLGFFN